MNTNTDKTPAPNFTLTPGKWHVNLFAPGVLTRDENAPCLREVLQQMKDREECERHAREFLDNKPETIVRHIAFKMLTAAGEILMTLGDTKGNVFAQGIKFGVRGILDEAGITTTSGNTSNESEEG